MFPLEFVTFTRTAVDPVQRWCRSTPGDEFPRPWRKTGVKTHSGPNRRDGAPVVRVCSVAAWLAWPTKILTLLKVDRRTEALLAGPFFKDLQGLVFRAQTTVATPSVMNKR